ncbi:unnamed protein product [Jaminaea pallidilutea]
MAKTAVLRAFESVKSMLRRWLRSIEGVKQPREAKQIRADHDGLLVRQAVRGSPREVKSSQVKDASSEAEAEAEGVRHRKRRRGLSERAGGSKGNINSSEGGKVKGSEADSRTTQHPSFAELIISPWTFILNFDRTQEGISEGLQRRWQRTLRWRSLDVVTVFWQGGWVVKGSVNAAVDLSLDLILVGSDTGQRSDAGNGSKQAASSVFVLLGR